MTTTTTAIARDSFLRFAIRLDAVLSALIGIVGVAMAPSIAEASGTTIAFEYSIGAFFIVYGAVVYGLSLGRRVRGLGAILVVGNLVCALLAVAMVAAGILPLTTAGIVATLASGVFTLVMADLQYLGLRRLRACAAGAG